MKHRDFLDELLSRSKGRDLNKYRMIDRLFDEPQALKQDRFDRRKYDELLHQAAELHEIVAGRAPDYPTWENLIQDAYLSLWKAAPQLRDQNEMRPSHTINWATMDKVMGISDFAELRTWTRLDDWAAAMGTVSLAAKLADYFDEQQDLMEKAKQLQQMEQEIMQMLIAAAGEGAGSMSDEEVEEFLDELEQGCEGLGIAAEDFEDSVSAQGYSLKAAVQEGMQDALGETEDIASLVQGFGTHPGQWDRLDPKIRMELAQRLQKKRKLQEIAKMVGRIKRMAVGEWSRRIVHGVDEIYDVKIGSDLEHVLASELFYLADEDFEDIFWSRWLEGTLLNYELRGTEKANRGAIICLLDNSGSMAGEREIWGKGVAMALLEIARREKRDFYGIHFASARDQMMEWHFKKGWVELSDVLDYAEYFNGGGTDFETPIGRAVEVLESEFREDGATKGDIVMITDGECAVGPEWLKKFYTAKNQLDFRLYGCLIGWSGNVLDQLSDKLFTIQDLTSGGDVKEAFTLI